MGEAYSKRSAGDCARMPGRQGSHRCGQDSSLAPTGEFTAPLVHKTNRAG